MNREEPQPQKPRRARWWFLLGVCVVAAGAFFGVMAGNGISPRQMWSRLRSGDTPKLSLELPRAARPKHMSRPYGMAPIAFEAYVRACTNAGIHPFRIGQTIGDHPRSVGYHKRDGVLNIRGEKIDYCAAVDLGAFELTEEQRRRFLHHLTKQGFASWYRSGEKWRGAEHIHAIYALLPMKPQLEEQVREFMRERRDKGIKPLRWERFTKRRLD